MKRHCDSAKHKNALVGVSAQPKISSVMATVSESEKVLRSELYFARFVAKHNLPFATADHFTQLCHYNNKYYRLCITCIYKVSLYVVLIITYSRCQKFISIKENGENSRKF